MLITQNNIYAFLETVGIKRKCKCGADVYVFFPPGKPVFLANGDLTEHNHNGKDEKLTIKDVLRSPGGEG
jgi:hypothetical protein